MYTTRCEYVRPHLYLIIRWRVAVELYLEHRECCQVSRQLERRHNVTGSAILLSARSVELSDDVVHSRTVDAESTVPFRIKESDYAASDCIRILQYFLLTEPSNLSH